ncbi:methyltransferase [Bradyrhizobium sp. WSM2254]|uniref:methyltransferase n=1 Tax=Bradyrhizobium sp. WSM2254 TaxID=1188263 RepID=UPI003523EC1D
MGFSMLGHGLCETLCLADINSAAVNCCKNTVKLTLEDCVSVYESNNLRSIPESERWNLVVSNPPTSLTSMNAISALATLTGHPPGVL